MRSASEPAARQVGAMSARTLSDRSVELSRSFQAPRALIWECFTRCEHLHRWWGASADTMVECAMDLRPGGAWRFVLRGQNGQEFAFRGEFRAIVPPERLLQTFEFEGLPGVVSLDDLRLEERDGVTTIRIVGEFSSAEALEQVSAGGMEQGAAETYDRLAELLIELTATETTDREIVMTRLLNAPPARVFDTWTDASHLDNWWGPRGFSVKTQTIDVRPGGVWRFDMSHAEYGTFPELVRYHEVIRSSLLVYEHGDDKGENSHRVSVRFVERDGKTELTMRSVFPTVQARDYVVQNYDAVEMGKQTLDKLEEWLTRSA